MTAAHTHLRQFPRIARFAVSLIVPVALSAPSPSGGAEENPFASFGPGIKHAVADYGWVGDAAHDNTVKMNRAFADPACNVLIIPPGTYRWEGRLGIVDRDALIVRGMASARNLNDEQKTVLEFAGIAADSRVRIYRCQGVEFHNLIFSCAAELTGSQKFVHLDNGNTAGARNSRGVLFDTCGFVNASSNLQPADTATFEGVGIVNSEGTNGNEFHRFYNCTFKRWGRAIAIRNHNAHEILVADCEFAANNRGIRVDTGGFTMRGGSMVGQYVCWEIADVNHVCNIIGVNTEQNRQALVGASSNDALVNVIGCKLSATPGGATAAIPTLPVIDWGAKRGTLNITGCEFGMSEDVARRMKFHVRSIGFVDKSAAVHLRANVFPHREFFSHVTDWADPSNAGDGTGRPRLFWGGNAVRVANSQQSAWIDPPAYNWATHKLDSLTVFPGDEAADLTPGAAKKSFHWAGKATITRIVAGTGTAPVSNTSALEVDVNADGASILNHPLLFTGGEDTAGTSATGGFSGGADHHAVDDGDKITIDIDRVADSTPGRGLTVTFFFYRH